MSKRRRLSPADRQRLYLEQNALCGCGCGGALLSWRGRDAIGEHVHLNVSQGNEEKPDSLWLPACAARKTNKLNGHRRSDKNNIAHHNRLGEQRTQADKRAKRGFSFLRSARKLLGRGFDKTKSRGLNGKVCEK